MKIVTNLTLAGLTILTLNNTASANRIHTLDDIHEADRNARQEAFIKRQLAIRDPKLLKKMQKEQHRQETETENFQGDGHKLGGDKYVNRLLGIDHKEGKRLYRLAKKQAKAAKKAERHHSAPAA